MSTSIDPHSKVRLATVWLDGCSGCHMSLLDMDEILLSIAPRISLVFGPLVDTHEFPTAVDVTLVEGAVSSQADLKLAQTVRANSRMVVALGDCAVTSNVPSMRNTISVKSLLSRVYVEGADSNPNPPTEGVPALARQAVPLHDVVKVDLHIPGCPPRASTITHVLVQLLDAKPIDLTGRAKFG